MTKACISATLLAAYTSFNFLSLLIQDNATLLSDHRKNLLIENKLFRWSINLHPINAAVSSNLGMVSLPSLHAATLALLIKRLLLLLFGYDVGDSAVCLGRRVYEYV